MTPHPITHDSAFSDAELCKIFAFISKHERHPQWSDSCFLFRLVLGTGLRVGEIPPLIIGETIHTNGIVIVRTSKTGRPRQVMASPELQPYIVARAARLGHGKYLFSSHGGNGAGFAGKPIKKRWLQEIWKKLLEAADVRRLSIHKGRHSYASWELASRRLSYTEVQTQLGHSKIEMTLGFYSHAISSTLYKDDKTPRWWAIAKGAVCRYEPSKTTGIYSQETAKPKSGSHSRHPLSTHPDMDTSHPMIMGPTSGVRLPEA